MNEAERLLTIPTQRMISAEEWEQIRAYFVARLDAERTVTPDE